jgi:putative SOS response-associated peptidase YedK
MPVVLAPEAFAAWLDVKETSPEAARELLRPAPETLFETIELHPKINSLGAANNASIRDDRALSR